MDNPAQEMTGDIREELSALGLSYDRIEVTALSDAIDKIINAS